MITVGMTVNDAFYELDVEPRLSLADFLREKLGLTGTNVGCEQGACGACTVLVDGRPMRSCIRLAVQHDGACVTTVEGLAPPDGGLSVLQRAFWERHAQQCGFCTPGMLTTASALLRATPRPTEAEVRTYLQGNICRCTGYENIVRAVLMAAEE
jgi:carbon-monoxide dehydrogenase small subunit